MKTLSSQYLSEFCRELALLLRSGVPISDSLALMRDDEETRLFQALLDRLCAFTDHETLLSLALEESGAFPDYLLSVVRLGERSGRLDEALFSAAVYYERRAALSENLRRAVVYPVMLLIFMMAVVAVLITRVLPIFNAVFAQVGAQMSGFARALMVFGKGLSGAAFVILAVLAVILLACLLVYKIPKLNRAFALFFEKHFGDRGVMRSISASRFAMAMAMAVSSGLDPEQALVLAGDLSGASLGMKKKVALCRESLAAGVSLEKSLSSAHIFSRRDSRLLVLGAKTGSTDTVMSEIAKRSETRALDEIDDRLRIIEPALVVVISLIVGGILLSVMLPLMGIMSSLG